MNGTFKTLAMTLIIVGTIFIVFAFLAATLQFNKTGSGKYNFLSRFPYELNQFKLFSKKTFGYLILMILASLLLLFGLLFYCLYFQGKTTLYFIAVLFFVSLLSFNLLFFVKLSNYRIHLVLAVIFYFSTLLINVLELFLLTGNNVMIMSTPVINIIVGFLVLAFMLVILINPSIKSWYKLVKIDAQTYNRPKFNYLAILEWGTLLSHLVLYIPLIVSMF